MDLNLLGGYIVSGLLVGVLVGLTGVGGGSLMTPLLVFLFGFKPATAVGTDLLFAALTKTSGVWVHHTKHSSVDWQIVRWLSLGSLPFAVGTLFVLNHFASIGKETTGIISTTLGIALLLTAFSILVRSILIRRSQKNAVNVVAIADVEEETEIELEQDEKIDEIQRGRFNRGQIPATVLTGAVLGILVTLTSVGAGALGTVVLLFLYPKMLTVKVVGTDLAHAIPLTAVAGFGHWMLGNVDFVLLSSLLIGSLPGIWIGSILSAKLPERFLRPILAVLLLIIGLKFVTMNS
ncbi:MAG: sulfite exporter TauE/SafE family protein [Methylococcales bacterium]|nr:sulfite exporter TauE/SafE family protein [Methylococcales bacterium]